MTDELPPSTPIEEVAAVAHLPVAVFELPGVRTLGDLLVVLERGEMTKELAAQIKKALKA